MDSLLSLRNLSGMIGLGTEPAKTPVADKDSVTVSVSSVFKTLFLAWAIYFVLSCVYNRYFHPLSKFPGPFWASVSNFWKLYIVITKESHTRGIKYHEKYGKSLFDYQLCKSSQMYCPLTGCGCSQVR
jgi:hypothetical protein